MLLRLLEEQRPLDAVVFYDTGMEFEAIYRIRDRIKILLQGKGIPLVELQPKEPFLYSMLQKEVQYRNHEGTHVGYGWCGGVCRWGTARKTQAISQYKKSLGDFTVDYVGIATDEPQRFDKAKAEGKRLPLVEWGMTERDCLRFCYDRGYSWNENGVELYDILSRVSCWCCRNKNIGELRHIYRHLPVYWEKLKELQRQIPDPMKGPGKSVFDLERRFLLEDEWTRSGKNINSKEFFRAINEG